jgi:hypothetical protein
LRHVYIIVTFSLTNCCKAHAKAAVTPRAHHRIARFSAVRCAPAHFLKSRLSANLAKSIGSGALRRQRTMATKQNCSAAGVRRVFYDLRPRGLPRQARRKRRLSRT